MEIFQSISSIPSRIVLFDGYCNLCNGVVQFIIKSDPNGKFRFTPLQSEKGKQLLKQSGLREGQSEFIVYLKGGRILLKSSAVLMILKDLGGVWRLFYAFIIVPKFIRDFLYDQFAKRRYKMFGKMDSCIIPSPENKARFID